MHPVGSQSIPRTANARLITTRKTPPIIAPIFDWQEGNTSNLKDKAAVIQRKTEFFLTPITLLSVYVRHASTWWLLWWIIIVYWIESGTRKCFDRKQQHYFERRMTHGSTGGNISPFLFLRHIGHQNGYGIRRVTLYSISGLSTSSNYLPHTWPRLWIWAGPQRSVIPGFKLRKYRLLQSSNYNTLSRGVLSIRPTIRSTYRSSSSSEITSSVGSSK